MAAVNRVNASNYVAAGKAAVNNSLVGLKSYRDNAPDYASLSETSRKARAAVKGAGMVAAGNMANTAASIAGEMQARKLKGEYDSAIAKEKKFAGKVVATGLLADDYLNPREPYQQDYSGFTDYLDQQEASIAKKQADVDNPEHTFGLIKPTMQDIPTFNAETTGSTSSSNSPPSSNNSSTSLQVKPGAYTGSLQNLSAEDKKNIAYIVSSEAHRGSDDIYGVAGVVLNRMESPNYPSSAYDVGHQKNQFEAVEKGMAYHDPELVNQLFSEEGLKKLEEARKILDGRQSFKGQALLQNRVAAEDPMFHSKGNFYHYDYQ